MTLRITRRTCIAAIGAAVLPRTGYAEQAIPTIGLLDSSAATAAKLSAFYEGLNIEGFARNRNVTIEYHSAEGDYARLPDLAADLVKRPVTLITALGVPAALAAKAATATIPVVFAVAPNPSSIGLVASLDRPGANMTGVTGMAAEREQKRLELLHASIPSAARVGLLTNPRNSYADVEIRNASAAAQAMGLQIKHIAASGVRDFAGAFAELLQFQAHGLVIADDDLLLTAGAELASLAARNGIPAIFEGSAFAAAGGLISYGTRFVELYHQAGVYSGLVLAGGAPGELPIYQSTGIEMILNLRSAKSFGISVPQQLIDRATMLIR
jgi:putative tryptophan/tyrosine transport system substrate-binding protein